MASLKQGHSPLPAMYIHPHTQPSPSSPLDSNSSEWSSSTDSEASESSSSYQETSANPKVGSPFHWHFLPAVTWSSPSNEVILSIVTSPSTSFFFTSPQKITSNICPHVSAPIFTSIFDFDTSFNDVPALPFELSEEVKGTSWITLLYSPRKFQQQTPPSWTDSPGLNLILEASQAFESLCSYISTDGSYF